MKRLPWKRWCSALCVLALVIGLLPVMSANAEAAAVSSGEAQFERFKSELTALLNNPPEITGNSSGLLGASAAGDDEYESARLLILADESLDTGLLTGAAPILYDGYGMWVAQFRTPAAAKQIANVLNRRGIVAEPDVKVELCGVQDNLKNWTNPNSWGVRYCHIKEFIEKYAPALEGKKAVVAVIDTGADVNFALLRGKVEKKLSFDSTPNNHGTGVAGIVIDCLYPAQVTVYDYDVGYYDESDKEDKLMDESCLLTCIKAAADDGADVINCSFGGYVSKEVFRSAIEYAISKGSLAVCAAGNDNADMSSYYPAALSYLDGCVAVSAGDSNGQKASFTNYGKGVELMAPGKQVFSCLANTTDQAKITDGTSLAAPHVSAAAALLKIATGVKTAAELEKRLLTATTSSGKNWIDKYYGYGFLDLDEAAVVPVTLQSGMSLANVTITDADGRQLYPVVVKTVVPPPPATVTVVPPPTVNPSPTNVTAASPSTSGTAKLTSTCTSKPKTGTTYVIESKLGNVWLNVANGTKKSGTNVQILNKRTAAAQKWSLVSAGSGYYYIKSALGGYYLSVQGGKAANKANVQISTSKAKAQKWSLVNAGSGYCYIKSALGNYYLSVQGSKAANKANVQICSSKTNAQKWTFAIYKK